MDYITFLGLVAGFLSTASFVPQLIKTWRTKSAKDLSYGMLVLFLTGILLWLIYGFLIGSSPIIIANTVTIFLVVLIIGLKIKYRRRESL